MKGYVLDYINENEFKKLERALKKYNMLAYKKLNFEYYPALRNGKFVGVMTSQNKKAGTETYELKLPSDNMFTQVHGDVKLIYTVYVKEQTSKFKKNSWLRRKTKTSLVLPANKQFFAKSPFRQRKRNV